MKKTLLALSCVALLSAAGAQAATGTITITGKVTDVTCAIDVNGTSGGDYNVVLPNVSASDLTATHTAGGMPLTISAKACNSADGLPSTVKASFETSNVNPSTGNLLNNSTGASAATNVEVQITNAQDLPIHLITDANNTATAFDGDSATMNYHVQYVAPDANATAGLVTSSVVYNLDYQ